MNGRSRSSSKVDELKREVIALVDDFCFCFSNEFFMFWPPFLVANGLLLDTHGHGQGSAAPPPADQPLLVFIHFFSFFFELNLGTPLVVCRGPKKKQKKIGGFDF